MATKDNFSLPSCLASRYMSSSYRTNTESPPRLGQGSRERTVAYHKTFKHLEISLEKTMQARRPWVRSVDETRACALPSH